MTRPTPDTRASEEVNPPVTGEQTGRVGRRGPREAWRAISLENKLAMFVAPVFVALVSGLTLWAVTGRKTAEPPSTPGAVLEVVAFRVADGADFPALDITVRNTGDTVAVITGATFVIRDFEIVGLCEGGNPMTPSASYPFVLPQQPVRGTTAELALSQQVPADEGDRFMIDLRAPGDDVDPSESRLYRFDVTLTHDLETRAIAAGTAILSLPGPPAGPGFLEPFPEGPDLACYAENRATVRRFVEMQGTIETGLRATLEQP